MLASGTGASIFWPIWDPFPLLTSGLLWPASGCCAEADPAGGMSRLTFLLGWFDWPWAWFDPLLPPCDLAIFLYRKFFLAFPPVEWLFPPEFILDVALFFTVIYFISEYIFTPACCTSHPPYFGGDLFPASRLFLCPYIGLPFLYPLAPRWEFVFLVSYRASGASPACSSRISLSYLINTFAILASSSYMISFFTVLNLLITIFCI